MEAAYCRAASNMLEGKVWPSLILRSAHRGVLWPVPIQSIRVGNASAGEKAGRQEGRKAERQAGRQAGG